jgi:hypothetical protein
MGIPNQGMISFSRHLATSLPFQSAWGRLLLILRRYKHQQIFASLSSWNFSEVHDQVSKKEFHQCSAPGVAPLALAGDYFWPIGYIFHTLPYLCWRAWWHRCTGPGWSWGSFTLNVSLHGTAWQTWGLVTQGWWCDHWQTSTICPIESFLSQSWTRLVLVVCTMGTIQLRDMGTKQLTEQLGPMRAACLASLSAPKFPQTIIASPF